MGLIIPKCNAEPETLDCTLEIYYNANDWVENSELIDKLSRMLIDKGIETEKKERQSYTKKTQVLSYYGLIEWEDEESNQSRRRITDNGRKLYEYRKENKKTELQSLLIEILQTKTFGRNVLGCDSDSDLEAPNIFLKSCLLLGDLTNKEFACILGKMEYDNMELVDALLGIKILRKQGITVQPDSNSAKWSDPKPILSLEEWGLLDTTKQGNSKLYNINIDVVNKHANDIINLRTKNTEVQRFISGFNQIDESSNDTSQSIYNQYLASLRTKPFMLLAGISGTGKSRIVRKLAQATVSEDLQRNNGYKGDDFKNDRWNLHSPANFQLIQVKPNWHNSMDVVGYFSSVRNSYVFTPFVNFIMKAWVNPNIPFFLCLDEMNLAPVEEYFAEYLSAIESRSFEKNKFYKTDPIIKPFKEFGVKRDDLKEQLKQVLGEEYAIDDIIWNNGLTLPPNLIVIGTVNMDETTFSFSRKVLDRAMSIEMNEVDYNSFLVGNTDDDLKAIVKDFEDGKYINSEGDIVKLNDLLVNRHIEAKEIIDELGVTQGRSNASVVIDYLTRINRLLDGTPFKLGYRAANEALLYLRSAQEFGIKDIGSALDSFTLMKILSRIEGDESKLKITDTETDRERLGDVNVDEAKKHGSLTILTAMREIIKDAIGEYAEEKTVEEGTDNSGNAENGDGTQTTETQLTPNNTKVQRKSIKKIDQMITQLERDHFISYWN